MPGQAYCVACNKAHWARVHGREKALQAMHDLCVWMLCQGFAECPYSGSLDISPIWQVNDR